MTPRILDLARIAALGRPRPLVGGPFVVRSSTPGEDEAGASFAGRYESVVGVRGTDALLEVLVHALRAEDEPSASPDPAPGRPAP